MDIINKIPKGIRISFICMSLVAFGYGLALILDSGSGSLPPVIKTVEVVKEVPTKLTDIQIQAMYEGAKVAGVKYFDDSSVLTPDQRTVAVKVYLDDIASSVVGESLVRSYVESQFRRNGFKIVDEDQAVNLVIVSSTLIRTTNGSQIAGNLEILLKQIVVAKLAGAGSGKYFLTKVTVGNFEQSILYGSANFGKIARVYDELALQAVNTLNKACERNDDRSY